MELFSSKFKEKLAEILLIDKPLIAVLHRNFVRRFSEYGMIIEVNQSNREKLPKKS
ncbi:MAG: nucleoside-triphosphatase [Candidatus Aenigmarchaeota archaeon]|nr:nucleoside-triphosphatase [Candidatus Aenigmarchaeota archaeon]